MDASKAIQALVLGLGLATVGGSTLASQARDGDTQTIPPGFGRLNQDNLTVGMRADNLDIRLTILQESGLRLLNHESYTSMHRLVESKRKAIDSVSSQWGVQNPGLLLARYFSLAEGVRFDAQLLTARINGQFYRPIAIIPLSASIQSDRLNRRQQAAGLYVFNEPLTPFLPMGFDYAAFRTDGWDNNRVETLLREQSRIQARVVDDAASKIEVEDRPESP